MGYDKDLTRQLLGEIGPLRFNPKVVKVCETCGKQDIVRYKGAGKPSAPYHCRSCVVNRPEVKAKLSESTANQWKNEEFAELVRTSSSVMWNDLERRQRMSKIHSDPHHKAATVKRNQEREYDGTIRV
jgi:hypothetical protein